MQLQFGKMQTFHLILSLSFVVAILADDGHLALIASAHNKREHVKRVHSLNTTITCQSTQPPSSASIFDHLSRVFCLEAEQEGLTPEKAFQKSYEMGGKSHTFSILWKLPCQQENKRLNFPKRICHADLGDIWFTCENRPN